MTTTSKRSKMKEKFEVEVKHAAYFTGGNVEWTSSGDELLCQCGCVINVVDVETGRITHVLGHPVDADNEDNITTFTLSRDDEFVVSSHKSGLFKLWKWKEDSLQKQWKSIHKGPVACLDLNHDGSLLASGGSDSSVRMWDLVYHSCLLNLRGVQGVVSVLKFHPNPEVEMVFAAADDAKICAWSIKTGELKFSLSGHFSKVTSLGFHFDGIHLASCGRDKVVILWDISNGSKKKTFPLYESLEGLVILPNKFSIPNQDKKVKDGVHIAAAGEKGVIRIWNALQARELYVQSNSLVSKASEEGGLAITRLLFNPVKCILGVVTADHNIILHSLDTFECKKQIVGFSDEILDVALMGTSNSHIAVATNSSDIKLYNLSNLNCQLLKGHTNIVLSLASCASDPFRLLSAGKDHSVRLWLLDPKTESVSCLASASRHTAGVNAVAFSFSSSFFVSAGQDCCIKLWDLPKKLKDVNLVVKFTEHAHEKDINDVSISPNDKLIATCSQDKTAKLWSSENLSLMGVLRGHRRGVWCIRFSPIDMVVCTTSADCCVKLWSVADLSCLKTLQSHESSVLRVEFLNKGLQLVTAGADGLLKLWNIKTTECVATFDEHSNRIWTLAVMNGEDKLVTGGADSNLIIWKDITEEKREEEENARKLLLQQEQDLANLVKGDRLHEALILALTLERPFQVLQILKDIMKKDRETLETTVKELRSDQKESLLKCCLNWNTNSKNCYPAQVVLSVLLEDILTGKFQVSDLSKVLEKAIPYTERHYNRLTRMLQDVHLLKYTTAIMQPHMT